MATFRSAVLDAVADNAAELVALSLALHAEPEIAYEERQASQRCREMLTDAGFSATPVPGLDTAFVAERSSGSPGPCVAVLAEYDALPEIGHGCGHNLIAGAAVGAGIALGRVVDQLGGTVRVYGCPAEEGGGGKIRMLESGVFDEADVALTFHSWDDTGVMVECTGQRRYDFVFRGRASHVATDPWEGASALDSVLLFFSYVNALRQHVRDGVRLHGIVTDGGSAVNVVPEHAQVRFAVRSSDAEELDRVDARLQECARAAALAADTSLEVVPVMTYEPVRYDPTLGELAVAQLNAVGRTETVPWHASASTDFGNVSQRIPGVLVAVQTWPHGVAFHTPAAAEASAQPMAHEAMLDGARVMALVGLQLLQDQASFSGGDDAARS